MHKVLDCSRSILCYENVKEERPIRLKIEVPLFPKTESQSRVCSVQIGVRDVVNVLTGAVRLCRPVDDPKPHIGTIIPSDAVGVGLSMILDSNQ